MCLKSMLFPVFTLPNLQSLMCFFFQRLYVLIFEQKRLYVLMAHVLIKMSINNGCREYMDLIFHLVGNQNVMNIGQCTLLGKNNIIKNRKHKRN